MQSKDNYLEIIPILGSIALGTQKLLPISQLIYSSWAEIGTRKSFINFSTKSFRTSIK